MTASDQLAEAIRRVFEPGAILSLDSEVVRAALAAYDAGRELREAEREALAALEEWRQFTTPEDAKWMGEEDLRLLTCAEEIHKLLAARKAKEAQP